MPASVHMIRLIPCLLAVLAGCQSGVTPIEGGRISTSGDEMGAASPVSPTRAMMQPSQSRVIVLNKPAADKRDAIAREALEASPSKPLVIEGETLEEVLASLSGQVDVPIIIEWPALESAGVERDLPVKLNLQPDASPDSILGQALREAAHDRALEPIGYAVRGGVVRITLGRLLLRHTDVRFYILPALELHPVYREPQLSSLDDDLNRAPSSSGITTPLGDIDPPDDGITDYAEHIDSLVTLIRDVIGMASEWYAYGGDISSIDDVHGVLVVRTSPENHAAIEKLLSQIFPPGAGNVRHIAEEEANLLVARADKLRMQQDYRGAMRLIDHALLVWPDHLRARTMKRVIEGTMKRSESRKDPNR